MIVLLAYFIVQWGLGIPLELTVIAGTSLVLTLVVYDLRVRRRRPVRFLFGMKPPRPVVARPRPSQPRQALRRCQTGTRGRPRTLANGFQRCTMGSLT